MSTCAAVFASLKEGKTKQMQYATFDSRQMENSFMNEEVELVYPGALWSRFCIFALTGHEPKL